MDALGSPATFGDPEDVRCQAASKSVSVLDREAEKPSGLFFLRSPSCSFLSGGWWRAIAGEIYIIKRKVRNAEEGKAGR